MRSIKSFQAVKGETKYINIIKSSDFIIDLAKITGLPLTNYFLTKKSKKYSIIKYKESNMRFKSEFHAAFFKLSLCL